ncbi:MAG: hypothetical protein CSA97_02410 [Bacteroidetes bacterium]|nr:MAG: hypothetical protein CSA97_02410 [Bacteroidota bacterium]
MKSYRRFLFWLGGACSFLLILLLMGCTAKRSEVSPSHEGVDLRMTGLEPPSLEAGDFRLTGLLDIAVAAISQAEGPVCFSPAGFCHALGMAEAGAAGETLSQLQRVALPKIEERQDSALTLSVANAVWVDENFRLAPSYLQRVETTFDASASPIPLQRQPEESAGVINAWSKEHTEGMIERLVDAQAIAGADLVLTNAIYFKGLWATPFSPEETRSAIFHGRKGDRREQMMTMLSSRVGCHFSDGGALAVLPYANGEYFLAVYLPPEERPNAIPAGKDLMAMYDSVRSGESVHLSLPRFRLKSSLRLNGLLSSLGVTAPLGPGADFSPMTEGKNDLFIQSVLQSAEVEVNEVGTEAAASTAIIMVRSAAMPKVFRADRPFLFFVCQGDISRVLFAGRVE